MFKKYMYYVMSKITITLENLIKEIRDLSKEKVKSNTLTEEQLYLLQVGYLIGLSSAATLLTDELDVETNYEHEYLELKEELWDKKISQLE